MTTSTVELRIDRIGRPQPGQPAADDQHIGEMMRHPLGVEGGEIAGGVVHSRKAEGRKQKQSEEDISAFCLLPSALNMAQGGRLPGKSLAEMSAQRPPWLFNPWLYALY